MAIYLRIAEKLDGDIDQKKAALDGTFISGVDFVSDTPDATKGRAASQVFGLILTGSINYNVIDGTEHPLNAITEWALLPAESPNTYKKVQVDITASDQIVRSYIFPQAFVMAYAEDMQEEAGRGTFKLELRQKKDTGTAIEIKDPYKLEA